MGISSLIGETIGQLIIDTLNKAGLDLSRMRGQSYDGGSNMKGYRIGVEPLLISNILMQYTSIVLHTS